MANIVFFSTNQIEDILYVRGDRFYQEACCFSMIIGI